MNLRPIITMVLILIQKYFHCSSQTRTLPIPSFHIEQERNNLYYKEFTSVMNHSKGLPSTALHCRIHYKATIRRFTFETSNVDDFNKFVDIVRRLCGLEKEFNLSYKDNDKHVIIFSSQIEFMEMCRLYHMQRCIDHYQNVPSDILSIIITDFQKC